MPTLNTLRRYGLTESDYEELLRQQGGKCAICQGTENELQIDHSHIQGVVRGLLCNPCNTVLQEDNTDFFEGDAEDRAEQYIDSPLVRERRYEVSQGKKREDALYRNARTGRAIGPTPSRVVQRMREASPKLDRTLKALEQIGMEASMWDGDIMGYGNVSEESRGRLLDLAILPEFKPVNEAGYVVSGTGIPETGPGFISLTPLCMKCGHPNIRERQSKHDCTKSRVRKEKSEYLDRTREHLRKANRNLKRIREIQRGTRKSSASRPEIDRIVRAAELDVDEIEQAAKDIRADGEFNLAELAAAEESAGKAVEHLKRTKALAEVAEELLAERRLRSKKGKFRTGLQERKERDR